MRWQGFWRYFRFFYFVSAQVARNRWIMKVFSPKPLTKERKFDRILWQTTKRRSARACFKRLYTLEMYSRGRRGAPAKGVGRLYRRESSNLSFSAKNTECPFGHSVFFFLCGEREICPLLPGSRSESGADNRERARLCSHKRAAEGCSHWEHSSNPTN